MSLETAAARTGPLPAVVRAHPGRRSRLALAACWLVVGGAMVAVPLAVGLTRWETVLSGHPLFPVVIAGTILLGLIAIAWAVAMLFVGQRVDENTSTERRTPRQVKRRATRRLIVAVPLLLLSVVLVLVIGWARPFGASPEAVAVTRTGSQVLASDTLTWYEMAPITRDAAGDLVKPTVGVVFIPGARVDSRAYARLLAPLAEAGYLVIVLKEPLGLATVDPDHAARAIAVHPEITAWLVGGHSVGGRVAATFADTHPQAKALLLLASYPAAPLVRSDLQLAAVYGTRDGLTPSDEVELAGGDFPAGSHLVPVEGANHASFGDFGELAGDGAAAVDRAVVREHVVLVARDLLVVITPPPPPPPPKKKK